MPTAERAVTIRAIAAWVRGQPHLENATLIFLILSAATSVLGVSPMEVAYGLAFACWCLLVLSSRFTKAWHSSPLLVPGLVFLFANFVVILLSIDPANSFKAVQQLGLMGMALVVGNAVREKGRLKVLVLVWLAAAAAVSLYAVGQYLAGEPRARAFFHGPMTLARILIFAVAVAVTLSLCVTGPVRWFSLFCSAATTAALCLTLTRGAWLALAAALLFLGMVRKSRILFACLSLLLCMAIALAALYPNTQPGALVRSIIHPADPSSPRFYESTYQRYWLYKSAIRVFLDHPITGVGQRNFVKVYGSYIPEQMRSPDALRKDGTVYTGWPHAHNLYLSLLATEGVLGFVTFAWLIVTAIRLAWRSYRDRNDAFLRGLALGILTAIVAFLTMGLFDENLRDSEGIMPLWFLMGALWAIHRLGRDANAEQPATLRADVC
jgi:O-antigen ligase